MLMTEWKLEDALVVERKEGREEGWEQGLKKGREEGLKKGQEETIISLLEFGMELEQISLVLKLPFDVVRQYENLRRTARR